MAVAPGRGRKPKPTSQKKLAGNPGKRALNNDEPNFTSITYIDPPSYLTEGAVDMWERVMPELLREKVLCITDIHNVEAFCMAYARWRLSESDVAKNGVVVESAQGAPMKNPALTAANEAMRQMVTFGSLLGLDPSSRSRVIGGNRGVANNKFSEILSG